MRTPLLLSVLFIFLLSINLETRSEDPVWQRTEGPDAAMGISRIVFHPTYDSILFAGANRGIYRSTDSGENWVELIAGTPTDSGFGDIAIDPVDPAYVYARTEASLYRSTNGGDSWTPANLYPVGEGGMRFKELATDPHQSGVVYQVVNFIYHGQHDIWKSENYGVTWEVIFSEGPPQVLEFFFTKLLISHFDSNVMWISTNNRRDDQPERRSVYVTTDGGSTWNPYGSYDPLEGSDVSAWALHPQDPQTLYLAGYNFPDVLYRTTDSGATWETVVSDRGADCSISGIYIDSENPDLIYTCGWGGFLVSEDAGHSWAFTGFGNLEGVETDLHTMAVSPLDRDLIYLGGNGGVIRSLNGGMNFLLASTGLRSCKLRCIKVNPYNPDEAHTLTFKGYGMYKTTNGGGSWFQSRWSQIGICSMLLDISHSNPDVVYATGGGAFLTTDGGVIWEHCNNQFLSSHSHGVAIDPFDENIVYVGIGADKTNPEGDGMYRTLDGGDSWENINEGLAEKIHVSEIRIDPTDPRILYHSTRGEMVSFDVTDGPGQGIFKSTNRGEEWFPINNGLANLSVHSIAINPQDPDILYACTEADWEDQQGNEGVFKSTNAGASWFQVNNGLPPSQEEFFLNLHTMVIDPNDPEILYVGRLNGVLDQGNPSGNVYRTTNGGDSWVQFDAGLTPPNSENVVGIEYMDIDPAGSVIYCGTYDSGVYKLSMIPDVDTLPPVIISGPALYDFCTGSVTVKWHTHEPGTSVIEYGTSINYDQFIESDSLALHHEFPLEDLDHEATYHFRVGSTDQLENGPRWSRDFTFNLSESDFEKPEYNQVTDLQDATGTGPFLLEAEVTDNFGLQSVRLYYSTDNGSTYNILDMEETFEGSYAAEFTIDPGVEFVDYYYEATDLSDNIARKPSTAPLNTYAFHVAEKELFSFLYVSQVDHGTVEINLKTGEITNPLEFGVGQWIPYANDSLMVGIRRAGITIVETGSNQVVGELDFPNSSEDWPWAPHSLVSNDDRYLYMVKWTFEDTISVIDLETLSLSKNLTLGDPDRRINGLALSDDGGYLYVSSSVDYGPQISTHCGPYGTDDYIKSIGERKKKTETTVSSFEDNGYLHMIDTASGNVVDRLRLGEHLGGIGFTSDFRFLYGISFTHGIRSIHKIDPLTNTVLDSSEVCSAGGNPELLMTRKSTAGYIWDPQIILVDLQTYDPVITVPIEFERQIHSDIITIDDNYIFFSDQHYGEVLMLDTRSNSFTRTFQFSTQPQALAVVKKEWSPTDINEPETATVPGVVALSQNYPNPANPSTSIQFDVPEDSGDLTDVRLRIYNIKGQLVRTVLDEKRKPGSYSIIWDGKNQRGVEVGSGIYLYELRAGSVRRVKKMLILR